MGESISEALDSFKGPILCLCWSPQDPPAAMPLESMLGSYPSRSFVNVLIGHLSTQL